MHIKSYYPAVFLFLILLPLTGEAQPDVQPKITPYAITANDTIPFSGGGDINAYNYFFSSEIHVLSICQEVSFNLFKSLSENYNVRNLLFEMPYSYTFLLNKFFETGDSSYVVKNGQFLMWHQDYFNRLYTYYQSLPPDKKFKAWGIDFDIQTYRQDFYIQALQKLLGDKKIEVNLRRRIFDTGTVSTKECRSINNKLRQLLVRDSALVRQLVQAGEFTDLSLIVSTNTRHNRNPQKREDIMFARLVQLEPYFLSHNNEVKAYGQFGIFHTRRLKKNIMTQIEQNKNNSLNRGHRLCTFGALFYNCYNNYRQREIMNDIVGGEDLFRPYIPAGKNQSVYLIPDTKNYNGFDFTVCYRGY